MSDHYTEPDDALEPDHLPRPTGRDEMNLAEFPFALLTRQNRARDSFTYEGWITDKEGTRHRQRWTVRGAGGLGLPTEYDERVVVALMAISAQQGFASRKVPFSIYQILQVMGLSRSQRAYDAIEHSLERLIGVTIYAEGAFWDNREKAWARLKSGFHLVDKYWLAYREPDAAVREAEGVLGYFVWSEDIWNSFQSGYVKALDLETYFELDGPLARRLYRFLDKRMAYQEHYQIDVFDLAGRLGMARYAYPSKVTGKLKPAIDELIAQGFLIRSAVVKVGGYTRIAFWKRPNPRLESPTAPIQPAVAPGPDDKADSGRDGKPITPPGTTERPAVAPTSKATPAPDQKSELVATLKTLGVVQRVAAQLVEQYDRQRILEKVDYLLWSQEANPAAIRNPHGWLRRAIEEDWGAPEGYLSAAEQADGETRREALLGQGSVEEAVAARDILHERYGTTAREHELWRVTLDALSRQMAASTYRTVMARTRLLRLDSATGEALVGVPDELVEQWLTMRLRRPVEGELVRQCGAAVTISCVLLKLDELL